MTKLLLVLLCAITFASCSTSTNDSAILTEISISGISMRNQGDTLMQKGRDTLQIHVGDSVKLHFTVKATSSRLFDATFQLNLIQSDNLTTASAAVYNNPTEFSCYYPLIATKAGVESVIVKDSHTGKSDLCYLKVSPKVNNNIYEVSLPK